MSVAQLLPHTVSIVTRTQGAPGDYNEPTETETTTAGVPAYVQPLGSTEEDVDRDTITADHRAYFLPSAVLDGLSAVIWEGSTYEVEGAPGRWDNARTGDEVLQRVLLRKITG